MPATPPLERLTANLLAGYPTSARELLYVAASYAERYYRNAEQTTHPLYSTFYDYLVELARMVERHAVSSDRPHCVATVAATFLYYVDPHRSRQVSAFVQQVFGSLEGRARDYLPVLEATLQGVWDRPADCDPKHRLDEALQTKLVKTVRLATIVLNAPGIARRDPDFAVDWLRRKTALMPSLRGGSPPLFLLATEVLYKELRYQNDPDDPAEPPKVKPSCRWQEPPELLDAVHTD